MMPLSNVPSLAYKTVLCGFEKILRGRQKRKPKNVEIKAGYLDNFPAQIITYNFIKKSQLMEIEYFIKEIHCIKDGKLYNISSSVPVMFYNEDEEKKIDKVIFSFVFTL